MSKPIAFIITPGKTIGAATSKVLQSKGYRIAQASRSAESAGDNDILHLKVDLTEPSTVQAAFKELHQQWGIPEVVIYNGATAHPAEFDITAPSVEEFASDIAVNTISMYAAAKEAVDGFKKLPSSTSKTFIVTGNCLNEGPFNNGIFWTIGAGKSATAHFIASASRCFAEAGFKFFYVDQRTPDGMAMLKGVDGPAHADFFVELIDTPVGKVPWQATFVAGNGYTKFEKQDSFEAPLSDTAYHDK